MIIIVVIVIVIVITSNDDNDDHENENKPPTRLDGWRERARRRPGLEAPGRWKFY